MKAEIFGMENDNASGKFEAKKITVVLKPQNDWEFLALEHIEEKKIKVEFIVGGDAIRH